MEYEQQNEEEFQKELQNLIDVLNEDSKNREEEVNEIQYEEDSVLIEEDEEVGTPEKKTEEEEEDDIIEVTEKPKDIIKREPEEKREVTETQVNMWIYKPIDVTLPSKQMIDKIAGIQAINENLGIDIEEFYKQQRFPELVKKLEYSQIRMKPINITKRSIFDVVQELILWRRNLLERMKDQIPETDQKEIETMIKILDKEILNPQRIHISKEYGQFLVDKQKGRNIINNYFIIRPNGGPYDSSKIMLYDEPSTILSKEEMEIYLKQELDIIRLKINKLLKILDNFKKMVTMIAYSKETASELVFTSFLNFIYPNQDFFACTKEKMKELSKEFESYRILVFNNLRVRTTYKDSNELIYGKSNPQLEYSKLIDHRFWGQMKVTYNNGLTPKINQIKVPFSTGVFKLKELRELWKKNKVIDIHDKTRDYSIFSDKFKVNNGSEIEIRTLENVRDSAQIMINNIRENKSYSKTSFWAKLLNIMILIIISGIPTITEAVDFVEGPIKYYDCLQDDINVDGYYSTCDIFWSGKAALRLEDLDSPGFLTNEGHILSYNTLWKETYEDVEILSSMFPKSTQEIDKMRTQIGYLSQVTPNFWKEEKEITSTSINKIAEAVKANLGEALSNFQIPEIDFDLSKIEEIGAYIEEIKPKIESGKEKIYNLSLISETISETQIEIREQLTDSITEIINDGKDILYQLRERFRQPIKGLTTRDQPEQTIFGMVEEIKEDIQNLPESKDYSNELIEIKQELDIIKQMISQKIMNDTLTIYGLIFDMFIREENFCETRKIENCTEIIGKENCYYEGKLYQGKTLPILVCENPDIRISSENTNTQLTLTDVETTVKNESTKSILITLIPMIIMIIIAIMSNLVSLSIGIFGMWWKFKKLGEIIEKRTINRASDAEIRNSLPVQNENEEY